ncbi:MAG: DUF2461 domain-containing protein [Bacteroidota bacterium]
MSHFSKEFQFFFKGLQENNHKDWFQEHRKEYEKFVKKPFKEFVDEVILFVSSYDADVQIESKDCIFRINRDIRFSKDKTPYKPHASAVIAPGGKKSMLPGLYIQMNHEKLWLGGGVYNLDKESLSKIRTEIMHSSQHFRNLLENPSFHKKFGELKGEKNKILPSEFKEAGEKEPLIYNKQFYYMKELDPKLVVSNELPEIIQEHYLAGLPVNEFLKTAMVD